MALLKEKYIYHSRKRKKGKNLRRFVFGLVCVLILCGTVYLVLSILSARGSHQRNKEVTIQDLWNEKNYTEIITKSTELLTLDPLDPYVLAYRGFSFFYKADSEIEEQNYYYD